MAYLMERLVDQAAAETGMDRIELRSINAIPKEALRLVRTHACLHR